MAISFPDFKRISFDEANPFLVGAERGQKLTQNQMQFPQDLYSKILSNQIAQVQSKYAQPKAEADIGLTGAQTGLSGAQTRGANVTSDTNAMKLEYLKKALGMSGGGSPQAESGSQQSGTEFGAVNQATPEEVHAQVERNEGQMPKGNTQTPTPASNNSFYGIETPKPTHDDIANKMMLGIDTFGPKMQNAKAQQENQYGLYQKDLADSIQEANAANNMNQAIGVFNNAMNASNYKGSRLGHLPSSGVKSMLIPGNLGAEQIADRAALQMLPAAIETLKDAMGNAKFSNLDMTMASQMKFDRTMDDETRATQTKWVNGVNDRMQERSKLLATLANPSSGAKNSDANLLWSTYQQQFPLISKDGQTFNDQNLGNWPLYTTPKAIASIKSTGTYTPSASERNSYMMQIPDGNGGYKIMPVKKGRVESAFKKGAKPV